MSPKNLQELLDSSGNIVELLRNSQLGAYLYPVVPSEFSNFRREVIAWRETAALYDQSHHMHSIFISGPDALKLVTDTGINSTANFPTDSVKQFVPVSPKGGVIGGGILLRNSEEDFTFAGHAPVANWLLYHGSQGYNVEMMLDPRSPSRPYGKAVRRRLWRFQIAGPNAWAVIEKLNGEPIEPPDFLQVASMNIAGEKVRTLRHGPADAPGLEMWGPYESYDEVRGLILEAGAEFGLEPCGARAYSCNTLETGRIPSSLPAIYTSPELRSYREWLGADSYEATNAIAGSFVSPDIADYYTNPWELGYGGFVKFDHDFIGRDALERMADGDHRHKVTLALDDEDVADTIATMFGPGDRAKFIDWPSAVYAMLPFDKVTVNGDTVGVSTWIGYSFNEGKLLTLAVLDARYAEPGTEVTFLWGEEGGGTSKPTVEPHVQRELRAVVSPVPYVEAVRSGYAPNSWRSARA